VPEINAISISYELICRFVLVLVLDASEPLSFEDEYEDDINTSTSRNPKPETRHPTPETSRLHYRYPVGTSFSGAVSKKHRTLEP